MRIGGIELANPTVLAPMAGVTDLPFRLLVKEMGCALVYSEMISDKGLLYNNEHTLELTRIDPRERPVALQIFGSEPGPMAAAAKIAAGLGADIIDINMGCPTPKIVKNGEGAALMRRPELAYRILAAVIEAVNVPVTVKIRKGWDDDSVNAPEIARLAEKAGVSAIAVHGRTRAQFYTGLADWSAVAAVKERVTVPVIGNGDVRRPEDAFRVLESGICDAVMIGRGSQGNPWIFRQVAEFLADGSVVPPPSLHERQNVLMRHLDMLITYKGEYIGIREMRRHAAWYTKGLPDAARLRVQFNQAQTREDFHAIVLQIFNPCRSPRS